MKLLYEIETNRHIDEHGEEIIETDAVECYVPDFDIFCLFTKFFSKSAQMDFIQKWNRYTEEERKEVVGKLMASYSDIVYDYFRQRCLDGVFSRTADERDEAEQFIEEAENVAYSANMGE